MVLLRNRLIYKQNRIESSEIDPYIYGNLIDDKGGTTKGCKGDGLKKTRSLCGKINLNPSSWSGELNVKVKIIML